MTVEAVRLYSVASAAELLEVSTDYVYDRISSGEIAVTELGSGRAKQRIRADVLQAFIDAHTYGDKNVNIPEDVAPHEGRSPATPHATRGERAA